MDSQDSPAKQFLVAVAQASQELEHCVGDSISEALLLNSRLNDVLREQIRQIDEAEEQDLRSATDDVVAAKSSILRDLSELRQRELTLLQDLGREFREYLSANLTDKTKSFDEKIRSSLTLFQGQLIEIEKRLEDSAQSRLAEIEVRKEESRGLALKATEARSEALNETKDKLRSELIQSSQQTTATVEALAQELIGAAKDSVSQFELQLATLVDQNPGKEIAPRLIDLANVGLSEEKIAMAIEPDLKQLQNLQARFQSTCEELARLQVGTQETTVRNVVVRHKTELLAALQHAEDNLTRLDKEVHQDIQQLEKSYIHRFEHKLNEFERNAAHAMDDAYAEYERTGVTIAISDGKHLKELFRELRKDVAQDIRLQATNTTKNLEAMFNECRGELEQQQEEQRKLIENEGSAATMQMRKLFEQYLAASARLEQELGQIEAECADMEEFLNAFSNAELEI